MPYHVEFSPDARHDLRRLYEYIARQSGKDIAFAYVERIRTFCAGLERSPLRGTVRNDVFPGLRIIGFEKRVAIAFRVVGDRVTLDRVLYGGRQLSRSASPRPPR